MEKAFQGKTVLVTGGNRNTGLAIVKRFLQDGARVFFCGSSKDSTRRGEEALAEAGFTEGWRGVACDVSKKDQVAALYDAIEREAGRLDVVVSNAANFGLRQGGPLDMTEEQFMEVLNTNLLGCFRIVQGACRRFFMRQERRPETDQRGVVVVVGSNSSERVSRKRTSYCSAKGAMDAFVKSLAVDLGPEGIRVNMVAPGFIRTDRWGFLSDEIKARRRACTLTGHESTGEDVAAAVAFLASDGARTFQGARLVMDSGVTAQLLPAMCEDDTSTMRDR